ncbi:sensor histidine kinase [Bradyrhizobium sp. CIAT3101]|uniref:sensor histidine kinase n=1 Tax=Bradyrhizobium sp. CIAT3101 TaxID=439387 RepID=UPI0024B12289|nr:sensor histidine kinase [Bradyrhizobium sp. CIAT3101]WFU82496.1 sensor histidine kinase [Bradyrhizobium sp. CIAT3101]
MSSRKRRPQEGVLLREWQHRIADGVASAIDLVSAAIIRAEGAEAKAALSDVVSLLLGHAEVHRMLARADGEALLDAAAYVHQLGCALRQSRLDMMKIRLTLDTERVPLQAERCWRLGLIVHDLIAMAAKHACFDARAGEIKVRLSRRGALVNCVVLDNGSRSVRSDARRWLRIDNDVARSLGGRVEQGIGSEFTSVVLSFPLTEREQQANQGMATRRMRLARRLKAKTANVTPLRPSPAATLPVAAEPIPSVGLNEEASSFRKPGDALGQLFSPSQHMAAQ